MDIQAITTLIGSLGFPIAACIAMFSMLNKERDQRTQEMDQRMQEMEKFTEAINNNTLALKALEGKLNKDG